MRRRTAALRARTLLLACATLASAGCFEYSDPILPDLASDARLNANLRVFDQGVLQVDGSLTPGRDSTGFQRPVLSPFILAAGTIIPPQTLGERGRRTYSTSVLVPRRETLGPFEIVSPSVRGVGELPIVRWYGLRRLDPDTIVVRAGEDVVLHMDTAAAQSQPAVDLKQWFLDLTAGSRTFRISATGTPPTTLRIPYDWVPESESGIAAISLIYYQSSTIRSADRDYVGSMLLDVRLHWVVRTEAPAEAQAEAVR